MSNNINTFNDEQLQAINNIAQNAVATVTKGRLIQFLQGKKADLPELKVGEPAFCTDDFSFYLGSDVGNKRVVMEHEMGSMSVEDGSITFDKLDKTLQNQINDFITLNDIPIVSSTKNGLMTPQMLDKLNNAGQGGSSVNVVDSLTSISATDALSARQGGVLKKEMDDIKTNGVPTVLTPATESVLGGVKVGKNLNVTSDGTLSVGDASTSTVGAVRLNNTLTSTSTTQALTAAQGKVLNDSKADKVLATTSSNGLMSSSDKAKLNGLPSTITNVTVVNNLTSTSTTSVLSAYQGKVLNDKVSSISVVDATTSRKGIVQLSASTSSTSASTAATSSAVKAAYDLANTANNKVVKVPNIYQSGVTTNAVGTAFGKDTKAGVFSLVSGERANATGRNAFSSGIDTQATGDYSAAIGFSTIADQPYTLAIGFYNKSLATSDLFAVGSGLSTSRANVFRVTKYSGVYGQGAYNSTGADYAEYFEWVDRNSNNEDRVGYFVTLVNNKIKIATSNDEYILGIVSSNPSVVGNSYQDQWQGMYVTDEWGRVESHYIDVDAVLDEDGNEIEPARKDYVQKLNPNFSNDTEYIPREQRKEWSPVGMLGQLKVRCDSTVEANGYCSPNDEGIATKSDTGYRVMRKVTDDIAEVLVK